MKLGFPPVATALARQQTRVADGHRNAGDWSRAAVHYRRALDIQPRLAGIWVQYGHALKEAGRIRDATGAYREALRLKPRMADTHLQLGHALKLQGRLAEAAAAYAAALALEPGMRHAAIELAHLGYGPDGQMLPEDDDAEGPAPAPPPLSEVEAPALTELLARHDLLPHLLAVFDPEYYAQRQTLGAGPGEDGLLTCLTHFCEAGLERCAPVSERLWFEPGFYNETYNRLFAMTDADAYRHWLNRGLPQGHAPNETAWLQDLAGLDIRHFDQLDLAYYRAADPELAPMTPVRATEWLVEGGVLDERFDGGPGAARLILLRGAARRATARGETGLAIDFLQRALSAAPEHAPTLAAYADRLVDDGQQFSATAVYRQIIDVGQATRVTYLHLAICLRQQRRFGEAYEAMRAGVLAFPQYPALRAECASAMDAYFHACVREYETLARAGRVAAGQAVMGAFCDVATAPLTAGRLPPRPVRGVALFSLMDLPQCRFYRVEQKAEQLERAGYEVSVYDWTTGLADFLAEIRQFQAVIFYRLAPLPAVVAAIGAARSLGLITFYEIDDLLFLADEYPGSLASYAGQITPETHSMLAMGVPLFLGAMRMCDHAIASTPTLAREMAPYVASGRAFVHRNGMSAAHEAFLDYEPPVRGAGEAVTIFYGSGTRAHKEDFQQLIEPALIEIARRHGKAVAFVMVGWLPISAAFRAAASSLTVVEPVFDLDEYWDLLREADINVAVLKPSLNVDCKSEIKWMEAGLFGVPSVVSRTATYAEVIEEGRTGFMCDTVADWVRALDRLVRDAPLRRRVGLAAQAVVRRDYPVAALAENLRGIMEAVSPAPASKRFKVLAVNVFYTPQTYGGATRVMHDNLAYLSANYGSEFEFEVFCCVDEAAADYVVESYEQDGIAVTGVSRSVAGEEMAALSDPRMGDIFRRHLEVTRPDLVHFHCIQRLSTAVVEAARAAGIPYVITAHDAWWISDHQFLLDRRGRERTYDYNNPKRVLAEQGQKAFARMRALGPLLAGAQAVLGVSEPFSALYRRCGVAKVRTVANGVSPLPDCRRTTSADGRVRLGHVGGMSRHKGFMLLKEVLTDGGFEHLSLVVVDHSRDTGETYEERWGTTPVRFIGKCRQSEVAGLYAGIDVLVAPSLWAESYGLVTREAQACGCWIVASDRGAIGSDVTEGVNGHVVDVSDARGLMAVLRRIDRDWTRYRESPPARELRTARDQGNDLAALYRELLAG